MKTIVNLLFVIGAMLYADSVLAQKPPYPPELPDARSEIYRVSGETELRAWIFEPDGHSTDDARPAVVFFFGGGWNGGTPGQFAPQARYLAERGMVAIVADYRVKSRQGTLANVAVDDAKAAVRWARTHAERLGIDPDRIAAGGGSAGGHLAAATALLPGHDSGESTSEVSARPNALLLFNPVLMTAPYIGESESEKQKFVNFEKRLGAPGESMSPYHNVRPGLPPTIVFHGEKDKTVPYHQAALFCDAMKSAGNRCELVGYPGQGHGFFNARRADDSAYRDSMARTDDFLVSLGWLVKP